MWLFRCLSCEEAVTKLTSVAWETSLIYALSQVLDNRQGIMPTRNFDAMLTVLISWFSHENLFSFFEVGTIIDSYQLLEICSLAQNNQRVLSISLSFSWKRSETTHSFSENQLLGSRKTKDQTRTPSRELCITTVHLLSTRQSPSHGYRTFISKWCIFRTWAN